jgi:hypothetical protein
MGDRWVSKCHHRRMGSRSEDETPAEVLELLADLPPPMVAPGVSPEADNEWHNSVNDLGIASVPDGWEFLRGPSLFTWILLRVSKGRVTIPSAVELRGWPSLEAELRPTDNGLSVTPSRLLIEDDFGFFLSGGAHTVLIDRWRRFHLPPATLVHLGVTEGATIPTAVDDRREGFTSLHLVSPQLLDDFVPEPGIR